MAQGEIAIGIDLGTTYSCVGVWRQGKVEIILNDMGNRITPSCVAFTNQEYLIGDGAMNQANRNPTNTIVDAKRLIGRRYSEEGVQMLRDKMNWPFKVIAGDDDKPVIVVQYEGEEKRLSPEEISAMVLSKMKVFAETFLGHAVKKAVVTVPAYFNNSQRQATKDAGTIAGLDVIHVLNEPTAAALAYGLDNKDICNGGVGGKKRILIFDLGGGTFDVSLLELDEHGVLEVKATNGDTLLGGQDFDHRMVDHLVEVFEKRYNKEIKSNAKAIRKLKTACEKAKRELSNSTVTEISIDSLSENIDFNRKISRVKFEELNKDLFDKCLGPLQQCLQDAKVEKSSVDEVVLVGGSTRIPKIQDMLRGFFDGKQLNNRINPDEAVACGASIQAASLNRATNQRGPDVVLLDVTPLSLGVRLQGGLMSTVISRNTRIPCKMEESYCTSSDNQTTCSFAIFEGERPMTADNHLLGKFELSGLRPAPWGEIKFLVIFELDENGILNVSARNEDNGDKASITITRDMLTLNKNEIDRMIRDARAMEFKDNERKMAILAKQELEEYASKVTSKMKESRGTSMLCKKSRSKIQHAIDEVTELLEEDDVLASDEYKYQKTQLQKLWEWNTVGMTNLNIQ